MAYQLVQDQRLRPSRPGGALALAEQIAGESMDSQDLIDAIATPRKGQLAEAARDRGSKYGSPPRPGTGTGELAQATPGRERQQNQTSNRQITAQDVKNIKSVYDFFAGGDSGVTGIDSAMHMGDTGGPTTSGGQGPGFWSRLGDYFGGGSSGAVGAGGASSLTAVPGGSGFGVAGGGAAHSAGVAAVPGGLSNAAVGTGTASGASTSGGLSSLFGGGGAGAGATAGMVAGPLALFLIPFLFGLSESKKHSKKLDKQRAELGLDTEEGRDRHDAPIRANYRSIYG